MSCKPTLVAPGTGVAAALRPGLVAVAPTAATPYPLAGGGGGLSDDPTNVRYQALTGTSVAAAHVAGTIALMQQAVEAKGCYLASWQVRGILETTPTPLPGYEAWEVGTGALDATAAVAAARLEPRVWSRNPWVCPPEA